MRKSGAKFIKKYGTPMIGRNFKPHVSLTSFRNIPTPDLATRKAKAFKFKPDALYVCELGPSHTCQRIVKRITFGEK